MNRQQQIAAYAQALASFRHDPLGYVMWAFPWGVKDTELENESGPDVWQRSELVAMGEHLEREAKAKTWAPFRGATASGHGIGKSAETSFVILWAAQTCVDARGVVTANSDTQLRTKTWAEVGKWWSLHCLQFPIAKEIFELTATAFRSIERPTTWRIDAIPNNPNNPAAFAGMHNAGKRVLMLVDEASEIEDPIWDTIEGALTDKDTELLLLCYGNPTKTTGRFKENVIGRFRNRFRARQIDSREVKRTNKAEIEEWVKAWGEDSDFVRVRVRGMFPRVGSMQLIPSDLVQEARKREPVYIPSDALVAGLDVARYGDDSSVLQPRKGRDAKTIPRKKWKGVDTMTLAAEVVQWCLEHRPAALFVDVGGLGAGVFDRIVSLLGGQPWITVYAVNFGGKGGIVGFNGIEARTANMAATMWVSMREWLQLGSIADDDILENDLVGREYGFNADNAIQLEKKEAMKKRGLASPDDGDALALTFAYPVAPVVVAGSEEQLRAIHMGQGSDFGSIMDQAYKDL